LNEAVHAEPAQVVCHLSDGDAVGVHAAEDLLTM
jgi:hypothetical protein